MAAPRAPPNMSVRTAAAMGAKAIHGPAASVGKRKGQASPIAKQVTRMELPPMSPRAREVLLDEVVLDGGRRILKRKSDHHHNLVYDAVQSPVSLGRVVEFPSVVKSLSPSSSIGVKSMWLEARDQRRRERDKMLSDLASFDQEMRGMERRTAKMLQEDAIVSSTRLKREKALRKEAILKRKQNAEKLRKDRELEHRKRVAAHRKAQMLKTLEASKKERKMRSKKRKKILARRKAARARREAIAAEMEMSDENSESSNPDSPETSAAVSMLHYGQQSNYEKAKRRRTTRRKKRRKTRVRGGSTRRQVVQQSYSSEDGEAALYISASSSDDNHADTAEEEMFGYKKSPHFHQSPPPRRRAFVDISAASSPSSPTLEAEMLLSGRHNNLRRRTRKKKKRLPKRISRHDRGGGPKRVRGTKASRHRGHILSNRPGPYEDPDASADTIEKFTESDLDVSEREGQLIPSDNIRKGKQRRRRLTPVRHKSTVRPGAEDSHSEDMIFASVREERLSPKQERLYRKQRLEIQRQQQQQRLEKLLLLQKQQEERKMDSHSSGPIVTSELKSRDFAYAQMAKGLYDSDTQLATKIKRLQLQIRESRMLLGQPSSPLHQRSNLHFEGTIQDEPIGKGHLSSETKIVVDSQVKMTPHRSLVHKTKRISTTSGAQRVLNDSDAKLLAPITSNGSSPGQQWREKETESRPENKHNGNIQLNEDDDNKNQADAFRKHEEQQNSTQSIVKEDLEVNANPEDNKTPRQDNGGQAEIMEQEKFEQRTLEQDRFAQERPEEENLQGETSGQEKIEGQEKWEKERLEKEMLEKEMLKKERLEQERLEKNRLEQESLEKERLEQERLEQESLEKERLDKERLEKERLEQERLEKERLEQERLEKERLEKERLEKKRLEQKRLEKERLEQERVEREMVERERLEKERLEQELLEQEKLEQERLEQEKLEQERLEQEKLEQQRLEQEASRRAEESARKAEEEKLLKIKQQKLRIIAAKKAAEEAVKVEQDRLEQMEQEKRKREAHERAAAEEAEQVRLAFEERIETERREMEKELERKRIVAIEAGKRRDESIAKRQEALMAAREVRLMEQESSKLKSDIVGRTGGNQSSSSKSVGSLLDGALGLLTGDPDSLAFPASPVRHGTSETRDIHSKKSTSSSQKLTSPSAQLPFVDPNSPNSAYSSPYGDGKESQVTSIFSTSPSSLKKKKKKKKKKRKDEKHSSYPASPTSSEGFSPQTSQHEAASGILPIDAYMEATEEKIKMERNRLRDYKRNQRKIHSNLVEQHLRHKAYVKQSKSVSPKRRRGKTNHRFIPDMRETTQNNTIYCDEIEDFEFEDAHDENWDPDDYAPSDREYNADHYESNMSEDYFDKDEETRLNMLRKAKSKVSRRRKPREQRNTQHRSPQKSYLNTPLENSPGQLLDASEYRRLRELER